jgi:hypothetical protein
LVALLLIPHPVCTIGSAFGAEPSDLSGWEWCVASSASKIFVLKPKWNRPLGISVPRCEDTIKTYHKEVEF